MNGVDGRVVAGVAPADYRSSLVRWAAAEAAVRDVPLSLATAVPPWTEPEVYLPAESADALREAGYGHLAAAAELARAVQPGLLVTTTVTGGEPVDVLRHTAHGADLLVVGADDRSAFAEALTGSVPGVLLTTAPCPLAVVPREQEPVPDDAPVVVALDEAGTSRAALAYAFAAADRSKRPLVLLRCLPLGTDRPAAAPTGHALALSGLRSLYSHLDITATDATGDPADVLVDHSRGAAQLVLGNRGHGRLTSTVFGSVSRSLIRRGGCPVVVAREGTVRLEGARS
jgi:nucleotide-binding universal stress UspA family protein